MPARPKNDTEYNTVGVDAAELRRYAAIRLDSGDVVIYDEDSESAWIQSPSAIGLEYMI
jgi:hypothetical protein